MKCAALLCVLLAAASIHSAQGSVTAYGNACGPDGGPSIAWSGAAEPGAPVSVDVAGFHGGSLVVLAVGVSASSSSFGPLPLPLPAPPFASGCELLASTELQLPMAVAGSTAALTGTLPAGTTDYHLYLQALILDPFGELSVTGALDVHALAPTGGTGAVAGSVTEQAGGAPVADARVTLFRPDLAYFAEERSDAAGAYAFPAVPNGAYRLGVAAPGFDYVELPVVVADGTSARDFALAIESHPGAWAVIGDTAPETLDATDIGVLLPDGRILYCHDTTDPIVFDPKTGAKTFPGPSPSEQGCMNVTLLETGEPILVGGQDGADPGSFTDAIPWVKVLESDFDWVQLGDMLAPNGRWYPGLARLNDGRLLVMGGGTAPAAERTDTCEVFDPLTQTWSWTGTMGSPVEFPPAALLGNGLVLRTWGTNPELYDPATGTWSATGAFNFPDRGFPGHSDHSLVVLSDGRALIAGVNPAVQPTATMTELYDPASGAWSPGTSPGLNRFQAEVVYLPDGQVLVQGGDKASFSSAEPQKLGVVKRTDLLDPASGAWRRVADTLKFREYHAVTLLVPDGRVVTTGGTNIKFSGGVLSADIDAYSPPYLFRGVRPALASLSDAAPQRGDTLGFDVFPDTTLTGAVLMGLPSTTHWVDGGIPRRLELAVLQTGAQASVVLPTDPDLLPVGWYLLFGMVDDIPSEALVLVVRP